MSRLWMYARPHGRRIAWGCLMLLLTNAAAMAIPQLFRLAIDGIEQGHDTGVLRDLALAILGAAAAGAIFRILSRVHVFYAARDVELELRDAFYTHLARQPRDFFEGHRIGDLMSRATNDLTQVRLLLGPGLLNAVNAAIAFGGALPLMLLISPELTAISLAVYVPGLVITLRLSRRLYHHSTHQQERMGALSTFVQETLAGAHVVRAFGIEERQAKRFDAINDTYYDAAVRLSFVRSYMWRFMAIFASLGALLTLWIGAHEVMGGRITVGELVALVEYLGLLAWPSFALGWVIALVQRGRASLERIGAILGAEPSIVSGPECPAALEPTLRVRHLTIARGETQILAGVDVDVASGETLGIVGPVGAGKSTLVDALVRQIDVPPGSVFVGGADITELDLHALRASFGFVHQTPLLFSKTVAENVAFGAPSSDGDAVRAALRLAAFEADLAALPQGLDTPVGERGITLSGGQKQRTAIARALLLEPPILVLDDALSAVDAETEAAILEGLRELRDGKTNVIVAHRISAVQHADAIIVLERGRVVERGDHKGLMAQNGIYARMARQQELERRLEELGEGRERELSA